MDDFKQHFSEVYSDVRSTLIEDVEYFSSVSDLNVLHPTYPELNDDITFDEVKRAINNLNRNKSSCPSDNLLNEYFLETSDILIGHLTDLFNVIFNAGYFPQQWSEGFIIPIHKKGDKSSPNNYRGITLMSNLGKLFTSILTCRVEKWFENHNLMSDAQFGFRKQRSTTDAIFVLHNLVVNFLNEKMRVPCAFIDLKKAFDSVYRNALWYKLFNMGLDGKILKVFREMYSIAKSCVKHLNSYSDFFEIAVGLKQGLNNSPIMFALFLEDLELYLQSSLESGLSLGNMCIILLLFADDMVIFGNSVEDLQNSLNRLHEYCEHWGLEVNINKTKVVVFRRRGPVLVSEKWYYNGHALEVVDNFDYLGTVFNFTGSFSLNTQYIVGKSLKAMNVLLRNIANFDLSPVVSLELFDAFVGSILNYGCPVWGFCKSKELERIHLRFCKRILGVKLTCSNAAIYGELGRVPVYINRYVQIIKYWLKVVHSENIILKAVYENSLFKCSMGERNWAYNVKTILNTFGFSEYWYFQNNISEKQFISVFKFGYLIVSNNLGCPI